jgi:hypothetical protein
MEPALEARLGRPLRASPSQTPWQASPVGLTGKREVGGGQRHLDAGFRRQDAGQHLWAPRLGREVRPSLGLVSNRASAQGLAALVAERPFSTTIVRAWRS